MIIMLLICLNQVISLFFMKARLSSRNSVKILNNGTDTSEQAVQTKIRLQEQCEQDLHCFHSSALFSCITALKHTTVPSFWTVAVITYAVPIFRI